MTIISRICSIAIITIIYIYASKIGKDIWNAKIECNNNDLNINKNNSDNYITVNDHIINFDLKKMNKKPEIG